MSSTQEFHPGQLLRAVQALRALAEELRALAHTADDPDAFLRTFLQRITEQFGALCGVVWQRAATDTWQLRQGLELEQHLGDDELLAQPDILDAAQAKPAPLVIPYSRADEPGARNSFVLIISHVALSAGGNVAVQLFFLPDRPAAVYQSVARFLQDVSQAVADCLARHTAVRDDARRNAATQLHEFTRHVHQSLDLRTVCYAIVNEGRRLIGCDRLSLAVPHRGRFRLEAISGQDEFDRRSEAVRTLEALANVVGKVREPLWYNGDATRLPPQIQQVVRECADVSGCCSVAVVPLVTESADVAEQHAQARPQQPPPPLVGMLILEQFTRPRTLDEARGRLEAISIPATLALRNALEHRSVFLMPVWKWIGGSAVVQRTRHWPRWALITAGLVIVMLLLTIIPGDFALEGRGTLEPVVRQDVFTAVPGVVQRVHVDHGQQIHEGQLLLELRNVDLEVEQARLHGELSSTAERLASVRTTLLNRQPLTDAERTRLAGEEAQLHQKLASLQLQIELFALRLEQLQVTSPIDGEVISWDVRKSLTNRPVQPGQLLLTVARTDAQWELLVDMPENRMGHVLAASKENSGQPLEVSFMLASEPGTTYRGQLLEVHDRAEEDPAEGSTVRLRVRFDQSLLKQPRAGAAATVKVHCGRRSLGYVWLHDVWEFIESRVFF